ncbi:pyruvate kinase [Fervidicella metallireducens AeB]|uniref:Pyruvate kinase n=1 Tax=Fervidicella metallireducens AeB TaxID=1403537 RepID=A0A017RW40_9CLOT|nr:pyruvate kinase [Fervidicella metallireducens]EYE88594.1 pyruvate kinase [Fervidicella metallireducens AeB]
MRKTKIVCTIGPTSQNEEVLKKLIENGLNAARLNFSHGTHEEHGERIKVIKKLREEMQKPIAIVLDTKGPEIRTGNFKEGKVELVEGQQFIITTRQVDGDNTICSVSYDKLHEDVVPGDTILIDDGLIGLKVEKIEGQDIYCRVQNGGPVSNHKGVNVPNVKINLPALTEKDIADIKFGIEQGIDIIAASFVRKASDVIAIRKVLEKNGGDGIQIVSKIENQEGVDNLDEIIKHSDGIMVARGDLGVEIPTEVVPLVQKKIIEKCNKAGKPVITATQMLDSMMRNPRPTRAEASDVANAIFDGTDAIMLSGETANGKYPVEAVATMARIAEKAETALNYESILAKRKRHHVPNVPDAISLAAVTTAMELNVSAIITATQSGYSAKKISKYRPQAPIIAVTPSEKTARKLSIVWGVYPIIAERMVSADEVMEKSVNVALEKGYVNKGELVVIAAGVPVGFTGTTNLMKVHIVGDVLVKGKGMGLSTYGNACVIKDASKLEKDMNEGDILVIKNIEKEHMHIVLDRASGVITEEGGLASHIAVECMSMGIPVIVGAEGATSIIRTGTLITMDTNNGMVYSGKANV